MSETNNSTNRGSKSVSTPTTPHTTASKTSSSASSSGNSLLLGRVLYGACLLGVAAVLGFFAYFFVANSQQNLAETQFESIAERALRSVENIAGKKQSGTKTMASVVAQTLPDARDYPFVTVPGFEAMASSVMDTSAIRELGFSPFVQEEQLPEFEAFAYDYFAQRFPTKTGLGVSPFGKGVFNTNPQTGERYHETTGATDPAISNRTFLTPILQHDQGPHPLALMLNVRAEPTRAAQMEDMLVCAEERRVFGDQSVPCGAITDIVELRGQPPGTGPGAVVIEPIYPAKQPYLVTAIVASTIVWDEILEDVFADSVSGIDCVLETTEGTVYSYQIRKGIARPVDWTDIHNPKYDHFQRSTVINADQYNVNSPIYTLHLYPNDEFYQTYNSVDPIYATLLVVGVMVFTSLTFVIYDGVVRKEFASKKELLEARRRFVRFISHEVRTPLNSVCMGLSLMQEKQAKKAGFDRAQLLTQYMEQQEQLQQQSTSSQSTSTTTTKPDPETLEEFSLVSDLLANAQSSVDVLNDFLNFDKIESGKLKLDLEVVPIRSLIENTVKEFRLSATKKELQYNLLFDDNNNKSGDDLEQQSAAFANTAIVGDQVRIKQVLRNLISNAIKFTSKKGKVEIRVHYFAPDHHQTAQRHEEFELKGGEICDFEVGGHIRVQVQDSGAGLTRHQLSKLFSEHIQFNPNDLQAGKGTGLGLFISKGIVEQHAGTLVASSEGLGHGSTFTVTLPLYHADASGDAGGTAESSDISTGPNLLQPPPQQTAAEAQAGSMDHSNQSVPASHRILIVDDALSNRKMMNRLLNHHGHTCELAEDGSVAIRMVSEAAERGEPYDTILMDYEMPIMNGPDSTQAIRDNGFDTFIVGVTGNMFPEDTERFLTCGANAVLPKPFKMNALDSLWDEYCISKTERMHA